MSAYWEYVGTAALFGFCAGAVAGMWLALWAAYTLGMLPCAG